jgi:hypothetical protein
MAATKLERFINIANFVKSFLSSDATKKVATASVEGMRAHHKGKGQTDERLTLTSFARAIIRLQEDPYGLTAEDATKRIWNMLKIINSYTPEEIQCISLTFGLEQSKIKPEIPQGKGKDGEEKQPIKKTTFENVDGQDMAMMLAYYDNPEFTKEFCKFAISSNGLWAFEVQKWKNHLLNFLQKNHVVITKTLNEFADGLQKTLKNPTDSNGNEVPIFRAPHRTNFILFNRTEKIAKLEKEYYKNNGVIKW